MAQASEGIDADSKTDGNFFCLPNYVGGSDLNMYIVLTNETQETKGMTNNKVGT